MRIRWIAELAYVLKVFDLMIEQELPHSYLERRRGPEQRVDEVVLGVDHGSGEAALLDGTRLVNRQD